MLRQGRAPACWAPAGCRVGAQQRGFDSCFFLFETSVGQVWGTVRTRRGRRRTRAHPRLRPPLPPTSYTWRDTKGWSKVLRPAG